MAEGRIYVLNPVAPSCTPQVEIAERPKELKGLVLGFLNNRKHNAGLLLEHIQKTLEERYRFARIINHQKGAAEPAPFTVFSDLSKLCNVVVSAVGD